MRRWLQGYYVATPLFALVDWTLGANVRAVGLAGHPELRAAWYAGCVVAGIAMLWRPAWSAVLGLVESGTNLLLLVLSILLPYWTLADRIVDGAPVENPITPALVTNFVIAGGVAVALFQRALGASGAGLGAPRV